MSTEYLDRALAMCAEFEYASPSVVNAQRLRSDLMKAKAGLLKATKPPFQAKLLQKVVAFCGKIGYGDGDGVKRAAKLLRRVLKARDVLGKAYRAVEQRPLEEALELCDRKLNISNSNSNPNTYSSTVEEALEHS